MISVAEALKTVLEHSGHPAAEAVPEFRAAGMVLAEEIRSDIDMPPFNRSAMDGYAIAGDASEHVLMDEITAGDSREMKVKPGLACPIMTGAPVPEGVDRVVMVERTRVEGNTLHVEDVPPVGSNICLQAEDIRRGQTVLERGVRLSGHHLGIAAMAGREILSVWRKPSIGLLTTGTEVVPATWVPSPGMVRNANLPLMRGILALNGYSRTVCLHSADDPESLRESCSQLLASCDVLITAGGVSMGTRDFVPEVLESLGVTLLFTEVAQKPGKPLVFGMDGTGRPVFGLPGNPVSVMVSMEEYVLPLLRKRSGFAEYRKKVFHGGLAEGFRKKPGRLDYLRVRASLKGTGWELELPETSGSGDLMSTSTVNALALVPAESTGIESGEMVPFHFLSTFAGESSFQ